MHLAIKCFSVIRQTRKVVAHTSSIPKRQLHNEIWTYTPQNSPKDPTILLFGYAGSPKRNLVKYETMYADLGYRSISTILPQKFMFHDDLKSIKYVAEQIIDLVITSGSQV